MRRFLLCTALLFVMFSTIYANTPPPTDTTELKNVIKYANELELRAAIVDYVYDLYLQYGEKRIPEEKFLIDLMHLINREVARRLQNPKEARQKYFQELHGMLQNIQQVKIRLRNAGIRDLDTFVKDLEARIHYTLESGIVDFKKKKVFEDALQMLYVSEEMIKLDRTQSPGDLSRQIQHSKEKLLNAFGEIPAEGVPENVNPPTIYDLFVEWKKTDLVKYELRLADVEMARTNLLKSSGLEEILRMFNDELKLAYTYFNLGDYDVAERLLSDLITTYEPWGLKNLDDLYFYDAECFYGLNELLHARERYQALIEQYPSTTYLPRAYQRLIQVNYDLEDYHKVVEYADLYLNIASTTESGYMDAIFITALSHYQLGNYDRTVDLFQNIPAGHPYYYLARYYIGNAYTENQLYQEAIQTYSDILTDQKVPQDIHSRSLYKLAILEYEQGNYGKAIHYLELIPETFSRYDKVLNALAWSYLELERSKPLQEVHDFTRSAMYAQRLVDEYYASPYRMEATSLLAYINQLVEEPNEALKLYRDVYQTKVKKGEIEKYSHERQKLEKLYREALTTREQALKSKNSSVFKKANDLVEKLQSRIESLDLSESSGAGLAVYREINGIIKQLKELNRFRLKAEETGNKKAVAKIDSLQFRLGAVLETFPPELINRASEINLFDDYPVSKYIVDEESRAQQIYAGRNEMKNEITRINELVQTVESEKSQARNKRNFLLLAKLEEKEKRLENLKRRYDQLLAATYQINVDENPYPDFNKWGDLGAFGIINVYFEQKQKTNEKLVETGELLSRVNTQLNQRKQVIEDKIKKIEAEIRFMTMKARMEERARLRAERERAFRESYFDTRTSERDEQQ